MRTRFVYLRITVDGLSRELSTKRQWEVAQWSQANGRATGVKEDARTLNAYLDLLGAKVFEAKKMLVESNTPVTADGLKNVLLGKKEKKRMLLELFGEHNSQMQSLTGREYSASTLTRYETTKGHIAAFIQWQYHKPDLELQELNYEFIAQLAFWFKSVRKCNHNSTMKHIKNFKKIVLECVKKGWLPKDPFT